MKGVIVDTTVDKIIMRLEVSIIIRNYLGKTLLSHGLQTLLPMPTMYHVTNGQRHKPPYNNRIYRIHIFPLKKILQKAVGHYREIPWASFPPPVFYVLRPSAVRPGSRFLPPS